MYGELIPVLIVRYEREYFSLNDLRITLDKNISYDYIKSFSKPTLKDSECVMEVKVPIDCDDGVYRKFSTYTNFKIFQIYERMSFK